MPGSRARCDVSETEAEHKKVIAYLGKNPALDAMSARLRRKNKEWEMTFGIKPALDAMSARLRRQRSE